jgi:hypothetical protein
MFKVFGWYVQFYNNPGGCIFFFNFYFFFLEYMSVDVNGMIICVGKKKKKIAIEINNTNMS